MVLRVQRNIVVAKGPKEDTMNRLETHTMLTYLENVIRRSNELQLEMLELWKVALNVEAVERASQPVATSTSGDEAVTSESQTYSIEEVATILGVGRATAYAAARRGDIPTVRLGRRLLVPRDALKRLLA